MIYDPTLKLGLIAGGATCLLKWSRPPRNRVVRFMFWVFKMPFQMTLNVVIVSTLNMLANF